MAVDLFANAANTTLTAALTAGATSLTVASSTPFPAVASGVTQFRVIIDSELFIVTNVTGLTWTVTPGAEGTTQAAHASGAAVTAIVTAGSLGTLPNSPAPLCSGRWHFMAVGGGSNNVAFAPAVGTAYMIPFFAPVRQTFDRMSIAIGTAGAVGALIRLAIYAVNSSGRPGALVLDAGTINATSTGDQSLTISQALDRGAYFLALVANDAAIRIRAVGSGPTQNTAEWLGEPGPSNQSVRFITYTGYTTGVAPSVATTVGEAFAGGGDVPVIALRAA